MKVISDEQLREGAWTEITGCSNCNKFLSLMCSKIVDKFLWLSRKTTAKAEDTAFLKEGKIILLAAKKRPNLVDPHLGKK